MTDGQNGHDAQQVPHGQGGMTSFDEVYDQPDPRAFFTALSRWEYQTPHHAQKVFRRLIAARGAITPPGAGPVVDLCCSYGINAALLNHDVTLAELYAHYTAPAAAVLSTGELAALDREFYAKRRRPDAVPVIGVDVAANALAYACSVGLMEAGFAENLETAPPSPELAKAVRETGLITVTGGASFLTGRTFRALLDAAGGPVWVAAFVLRTGSYQEVARALDPYGLVTESPAEPTFPQRRFTHDVERGHALAAVTALGLDTRGKEADGWFHTAFHLSRPAPHAPAAEPALDPARLLA